MKSIICNTVIAAACLVMIMVCSICASAADGGDSEGLTESARRFLFTTYKLDRAQFVLQEAARPLSLPGNIGEIEVRCPRWGKWWAGLEIYQKGRLLRTAFIKFNLLKVTDVLVALRPIKSRETLRPEDFVAERKAILIKDDIEKKLITSHYAIQNRRARYFIAEGTPLTADKVEAVPLVCRNDEARAVLERDGFGIESTCRALDNGFCGSTIRVRLLNGKTVQGVIDESGLVHVKF